MLERIPRTRRFRACCTDAHPIPGVVHRRFEARHISVAPSWASFIHFRSMCARHAFDAWLIVLVSGASPPSPRLRRHGDVTARFAVLRALRGHWARGRHANRDVLHGRSPRGQHRPRREESDPGTIDEMGARTPPCGARTLAVGSSGPVGGRLWTVSVGGQLGGWPDPWVGLDTRTATRRATRQGQTPPPQDAACTHPRAVA